MESNGLLLFIMSQIHFNKFILFKPFFVIWFVSPIATFVQSYVEPNSHIRLFHLSPNIWIKYCYRFLFISFFLSTLFSHSISSMFNSLIKSNLKLDFVWLLEDELGFDHKIRFDYGLRSNWFIIVHIRNRLWLSRLIIGV